MDDKNLIYTDDEIEQIEELEKLSDHQLKARLVYELNKVNSNYADANASNIEKFYEYLNWFHDLKDEKEQMSFTDYQDLNLKARRNFFEDERKNFIETLKKRQEIQEQIRELNEKNKEDMEEQIKEYCKNNDDWMLKHVTERIEFFRKKNFCYKFYNWTNYGVDNIKDARFRLLPLTKDEIRFIIEPIYEDKNQN